MSKLLTLIDQPIARYFLIRHVTTETTCSIRCCSCGLTARVGIPTITTGKQWAWSLNTLASHFSRSIVVAVACRLEEFQGQINLELDLLAGNNRTNNEGEEDNEKHKVQNGVTNYSALAKLGLLQRVDRRTDLATINC